MIFRKFALLPLLLAFLTLTACDSRQPPAPQETSENSQLSAQDNGLPPGIRHVETIDAEPVLEDGVVIPYSKYVLDNGLTLIIHEDDSDPLVHVDVTYHVGSAREEPRRSGFAHFFEHMMFQGSANVDDDEHFRIITEAGGTMNGTTNTDRTNYFQTVPSNQLETVLWLESDRMGFLLEAVTQEKFENQRDTVKNERSQNVDNRPYGRFSEVNNAALYPPEHPYSWPVIGFMDDLDAATLDDLKRFFLRWYGPNNATLSIGGQLDKDEVIRLVLQYFGEIPPGPAVEADSQPPASLDRDRYVSYVDDNIRFPALLFTWPTVPLSHPDRIALDALNSIVGQGRKSVFYKDFILTQKAIDASGFHNSQELGGSLTFFVLPFPGTPLDQFEEEMRDIISRIGDGLINEEDIQIFRAQQESRLISSLASVRGKVSQLAYNETFLGNPNNIQEELRALRELTLDDVLRVYQQYVQDRPAIIQSVVPGSAPDSAARPDNFEIPERLPRQESETADLEERLIQSAFDRSRQPEAGPAPLVDMPAYWQAQLDGRIPMIGTLESEIPMTTLRLVFDGGHLTEAPEHYGLANLTAMMMNEGTENFSAEAFEMELQKLGSAIGVSASSEQFSISVQSLDRHLDATLDLLEERLFRSVLTEADLNRLRQQQIESLEADKEQPSSIASNVYRRLLYGEDHAQSVSSAGTESTLSAITLADVEAFREQSLAGGSLYVIAVGDIDDTALQDRLAFLSRLPDQRTEYRPQPAPPETGDTRIYLVDKARTPQAEIRIGYMGDMPYDPTGEYFERYLMNYPLGGAFNSRINMNLREDKGYTYGARSGFSGSRFPGPFTASAGVRIDATADAIVQFMKEMTEYRDQGITPEELQFTKSAVGQSEALDYETPGQKASLLQRIITMNLEGDFVRQQQAIIDGLSRERVNELARKHLPVENMYIVVVGDKSVIGDSLDELGYPITELSVEGLPLEGE